MFVSFDFEVDGDVTPEEAIHACRSYMASYKTDPAYEVELHRGTDEKIPATVMQTLVRASHTAAAEPMIP